MTASETEITICNQALTHLGISVHLTAGDGIIANNADGSAEAILCQQMFPASRDLTLEEFSWPFARQYVSLGTAANDGVGEVWEDEWDNAYTYPSNCLLVRRFVTFGSTRSDLDSYGRFNSYHPEEWPFVIRHIDDAKVIMTDVAEADAIIEYTATQDSVDVADWPATFSHAVSMRLGSLIAPAIVNDDDRAQKLFEAYIAIVMQAKAAAANESGRRAETDQPFVQARGRG